MCSQLISKLPFVFTQPSFYHHQVTVYVEDYHRHPAKGVEVIWHLGYGLGQAKTRTGTNGKTYIFAPIGELLVIEAKAHYCSSGLAMVEANPDEKVTLKCQ